VKRPSSRRVALLLLLLAAAGLTSYLLRDRLFRPDFQRRGGTLLTYAVDEGASPPGTYDPDELAAALARRLGASWRNGLAVRPARPGAVEVAIPRTRSHDAEVERVKQLVREAGSLEFRILANEVDDQEALVVAAWRDLTAARTSSKVRAELARRARLGLPPPPPVPPTEAGFKTPLGTFTYSWVELGPALLRALNLDSAAARDPKRRGTWRWVAEARLKGEPVAFDTYNNALLYSRQRAARQADYFFLCRDPERDPETGALKTVTGADLLWARASKDKEGNPAVAVRFTKRGGARLHELTSRNRPAGPLTRHLGVLVDGKLVCLPGIKEPIRTDALFSGKFTDEDVEELVAGLRAGALPARLVPEPAAEKTVGPR
jgi:preprotein translocase subunit SecD